MHSIFNIILASFAVLATTVDATPLTHRASKCPNVSKAVLDLPKGQTNLTVAAGLKTAYVGLGLGVQVSLLPYPYLALLHHTYLFHRELHLL
jgi:hypothetical protein